MAWNPSPKVAAAREIGRRFRKDQVIVFLIDRSAGTLEYASRGETPGLCAKARRSADIAFEAILEEERNG